MPYKGLRRWASPRDKLYQGFIIWYEAGKVIFFSVTSKIINDFALPVSVFIDIVITRDYTLLASHFTSAVKFRP